MSSSCVLGTAPKPLTMALPSPKFLPTAAAAAQLDPDRPFFTNLVLDLTELYRAAILSAYHEATTRKATVGWDTFNS